MIGIRQRCFAFYGHSGSGKSSAARVACDYFRSRGLETDVVKLAAPLYRIQEAMYRAAGIALDPGEQDQMLLRDIATHLRRISPTSLIDDFAARLAVSRADVIVNDDVRDLHVDYPYLRSLGFFFIRIDSPQELRDQRVQRRGDRTSENGASTCDIDAFEADVIIENRFETCDGLGRAIERVLEPLFSRAVAI